MDLMHGQGEFDGIWVKDQTTGIVFLREDLLRKQRKIVQHDDINHDWIQYKNSVARSLHTGRNVRDRAKEILRTIRKVNPLFQKYLKEDGTPELSGWNTIEKVMNAILDELWKEDWVEKKTKKLKKERKDLLEKLSAPSDQAAEIDEFVSTMCSDEEEERTDDEEVTDDSNGDDTANKCNTESPSDSSSSPPNRSLSSSTVDNDGRDNDKVIVVDDDDSSKMPARPPTSQKKCGTKKPKLRHTTASSLDEMNDLHVDTDNIPPRPQHWIPKDWASIVYFAPTKENIDKKRTLAQVQQHETHLLTKNNSAKKKRVDPDLGRSAAKKQQQEEASAAKKKTGGSMNAAAKDQDPKERIADEFARSNKLFAQSQDMEKKNQDRETVNQLMLFNQNKIERIERQMMMYDKDSTKYADYQVKLDAAEEEQETLYAKLSSFASSSMNNVFETPKKLGE